MVHVVPYFDTTTQVAPGNVNLRFRVRTGGGQNTGGDGFAMSIFEVNTVEELQTLLARPLVEAASATALPAAVPVVSVRITVRLK